MTTGRINQVAAVQPDRPKPTGLLGDDSASCPSRLVSLQACRGMSLDRVVARPGRPDCRPIVNKPPSLSSRQSLPPTIDASRKAPPALELAPSCIADVRAPPTSPSMPPFTREGTPIGPIGRGDQVFPSRFASRIGTSLTRPPCLLARDFFFSIATSSPTELRSQLVSNPPSHRPPIPASESKGRTLDRRPPETWRPAGRRPRD